ncbi:MAG: methylaspartate mutase subunit E [Chloroflexi bacterium]|nr:methylaspartate mutase subunit E [Chloroflexota bacterium]
MRPWNGQWDEDDFLRARRAVLAAWPTGADVDLGEAVAFQKTLPPHQRESVVLAQAKAEGRVLKQPRAGVAVLEEHVRLMLALQDEGGADILPTTVDSYTRNLKYADAERALAESRREGRSLLNGLPVVNYGPRACRQIVAAVDRPLCIRTAAPDVRLTTEVLLAAGCSGQTHGPLADMGYSKDTPVAELIACWQYVNRLCAYYTAHGAPIVREHYVPSSSVTLPSMQHALTIFDALLALEQGVRHVNVGYGQYGALLQDVAALLVLPDLMQEYATRLGFGAVQITCSLHQWMGAFPEDEAKAFGVICLGSAAAALGGANMIHTKTPHEAWGIPTAEANVQGLKATGQTLRLLRNQRLPVDADLELEMEMIRRETRTIVERTLELGDGQLWQGITRAFEAGVLDMPFSPSRFNAGKVLPARDRQGAGRYLDCGNVPFDAEVREYHRAKIAERAAAEGRSISYDLVIDDVYALSEATS